MWASNQLLKASSPVTETSSTSALSNTVCICDPDGHWQSVSEKPTKDLSEFGEIARLDTSLAVIARCVLVTYFDVRCAQRLMLSSPGRCEPFPPAAHDVRTVRVNLQAFTEEVDHMRGGFNQFGEVAHISASHGHAIVEFFDIRSAQMLLAAASGSAIPWSPDQTNSSSALLSSLGAGNWPLGNADVGGLLGYQNSMNAMDAQDLATAESPQADDKKGERGNRPLRTKVSTKEFSKYDIDPERIERGEDARTTVMVRNVAGNNARKEFLNLMEKFGLSDRFTFFYMPCKEHRNVLAGFAFVNFVSPLDVHKLFVMVRSGAWREVMSKSQTKAPGVSYARFQGHEELVEHFSSSAVLHEQDPEKRPIFRPDAAAKAAKEKKHGSKKESSPLPKVSNGAPGLTNGPGNAWMSLLTPNELNEASQKIMSTPPAYVKSSLMEAPEDSMDAAPPQMGA